MEIKAIDSFTIEECREYINLYPNGENIFEVTKRLDDLLEVNKSQLGISPTYIRWGDFCSEHPIYTSKSKFNWKTFKKIASISFSIFIGLLIVLFVSHLFFGSPHHIDDIGTTAGLGVFILIIVFIWGIIHCFPITGIFDIEDTESEYKIVRAPVLTMGVYRFSNNKVYCKIPLLYNKIVHIGDGTYLLEKDGKKGLLNILANEVWLHPMDNCEISWENNIISISKDGQIIKRITTRGFKYED